MNQFWILDYPLIRDSSGVKTPVREIMRWYFIVLLLIAFQPLRVGDGGAAERKKPVLIGVLTDSWGPTPGVVGLRDGLKERGYLENQDFVVGVRFTQVLLPLFPKPRANSCRRA